jgi:YVTN family beta-propeller protein
MIGRMRRGFAFALGVLCLIRVAFGAEFLVCVSNERGGTVSVFKGPELTLVKDVHVGKRPRGIHPSPDGKYLFVAVSGSPITGPPKLDVKGNPIPEKEDDEEADHSADGIAVVDLAKIEFVRKLPAGSDPEEFAVLKDGQHLVISNEDVGTASFLNVATEKVETIVPVKREPEGVALTPDGEQVYVTCEAGGEVFVIGTGKREVLGKFVVGGRPRSVAFVPDGSRAYVPSESAGQLHLIDAKEFKVLSTLRLPNGYRPMKVLMRPDGKKLYASTGRAGLIALVDPVKFELVNSIKVGARPWGIAFSPDAKVLYVANGPSNDVSIVDLESEKELRKVKAGEGPWGVVVVKKE